MEKKGARGTGPMADKERLHVSIDRGLLEWIESNCRPGGPFGSVTHAVEFALKRLKDEEEALREACERNHVAFESGRLWGLYQKASLETRRHRR